MKLSNLNKKAQSLPLNTIVIAILVIIVLLVIIVFFTSKIGDTSEQLDQQGISDCNEKNSALTAIGYTEFVDSEEAYNNLPSADKEHYTKVPGIANCWAKK